MRNVALIAVAAVSLCACSTVKETIAGPQLAPMGYPAGMTPQTLNIVPQPAPQAASPNSLWRTGARTFFADQRARNVGDILTVKIQIDDKAQVSNSTNRSRSNNVEAGVSHFFGLENSLGRAFPSGFDPNQMIGMNGETGSQGSGVISRSEKVNLTIAAVVTGVMPNGNLVIQGRQEVRTNAEVRELTVAGIVNPADISSQNTIDQTQIAEARISYGGRGDVTTVQRAPAAQRVVERFSPF
ncbi:MAG: flagellar basal body L-ring protein FlgH [Caulobacteraceae bacterium]|nr:flagellar basal body L-ring protein FlgH [Caulobacteraceae bacterium]